MEQAIRLLTILEEAGFEAFNVCERIYCQAASYRA